MSVSRISNDSSDKSKAIWLPCPANGSKTPHLFENLSIPASTPLLVGSTSSNTLIVFEDPDSSSVRMKTVTIENGGDAKDVMLPKNCSKVWVYVNTIDGAATVSIAIRSDAQTPTVKAASLLTYTTTASSPGLTGKGIAFVVGGGGSSAYVDYSSYNNYYGAQMMAAAGGGGSGGMNSGYISDLSTVTAITIGGGGYGDYYYQGGSGGATSITANTGSITANGGGGGARPASIPNNSAIPAGPAGNAGTPSGATGSPGLVMHVNSGWTISYPNYSTFTKPDWYPEVIVSGGSGPLVGNTGTNLPWSSQYNSIVSRYTSGNLGNPGYPSGSGLYAFVTHNSSTGFGSGSNSGGAYSYSAYGPPQGRQGVVYILRWTE